MASMVIVPCQRKNEAKTSRFCICDSPRAGICVPSNGTRSGRCASAQSKASHFNSLAPCRVKFAPVRPPPRSSSCNGDGRPSALSLTRRCRGRRTSSRCFPANSAVVRRPGRLACLTAQRFSSFLSSGSRRASAPPANRRRYRPARSRRRCALPPPWSSRNALPRRCTLQSVRSARRRPNWDSTGPRRPDRHSMPGFGSPKPGDSPDSSRFRVNGRVFPGPIACCGGCRHVNDRCPGACARTRPPWTTMACDPPRSGGSYWRRYGGRDGRGGRRRRAPGLTVHFVRL